MRTPIGSARRSRTKRHRMLPIAKKAVFAIFTLLFLSLPVSAANLSVPSIELMSHGAFDGTKITLGSRIYLDMLIDGGSKFLGSVKLNFNSGNLENDLYLANTGLAAVTAAPTVEQYNALIEKLNNPSSINFKSASVTILKLFTLPFDFTFFVGDGETFCSGEVFPRLFGTSEIASAVKGYSYYPNGVGGNPDRFYDGIHAVSGTGISFSSSYLAPWFLSSLYLYQDTSLGQGKFSADARFLFNFENLKMEAFLGTSQPISKIGLYRLGFLFYFSTGTIGDFYAQMGLPYFDPSKLASFSPKLFFFLFEPRVKLGFMDIIITFFYHPDYYQQKSTNEGGLIDINGKFLLGSLEKYAIQGGGETMLTFDSTASTSPLKVSVAPFLDIATSGVIWNLKVNARVYPLPTKNLLSIFELFLGVRAGF